MGFSKKSNKRPQGLSRRHFLGAAAGSAALSLFHPKIALGSDDPGDSVLTDYVGRLCYNENPLGPSPDAVDAMTGVLNMGHRYPDWFAESLRDEIADFLDISSSRIRAGVGATELLRLCAMAFATPGSKVICPYPSYSQFPADADRLGADVEYSDLDDSYRVDLEDIASRIDGNTSAVMITNPNNPTGTIVTSSDLQDFIDSVPDYVTVIIDNAYHDYVDDLAYEDPINYIRDGKKLVVIRTFSKAYGLAGIRVGYCVAHPDLMDEISPWIMYAMISRPSLAAGIAALYDVIHLNNTITLNNNAKGYCFNAFNDMDLDYIPSHANFFMVNVGNAGWVANQLSQNGIAVRTGWGMENHIRVSTGLMDEMEDFIETLDDILNNTSIGGGSLPLVTSLDGNYPNPFNSSTKINFNLGKQTRVELNIYDIRGRLVRSLIDNVKSSGSHSIVWDARNGSGNPVASGSYFFRLRTDDYSQTRKLMLIR